MHLKHRLVVAQQLEVNARLQQPLLAEVLNHANVHTLACMGESKGRGKSRDKEKREVDFTNLGRLRVD